MLVPAKADLKGVIGATWEASIILYSDDAETVPFNLSTAYDVSLTELQLDGVAILTPTDELTITAAAGRIDATMTPSQTDSARGTTSWRLKLTRLDGINVDYPIGGLCRWTMP